MFSWVFLPLFDYVDFPLSHGVLSPFFSFEDVPSLQAKYYLVPVEFACCPERNFLVCSGINGARRFLFVVHLKVCPDYQLAVFLQYKLFLTMIFPGEIFSNIPFWRARHSSIGMKNT